MNDPISMDWKQFAVRVLEAIAWPVAFIAVVTIFRQPIYDLLAGVAAAVVR